MLKELRIKLVFRSVLMCVTVLVAGLFISILISFQYQKIQTIHTMNDALARVSDSGTFSKDDYLYDAALYNRPTYYKGLLITVVTDRSGNILQQKCNFKTRIDPHVLQDNIRFAFDSGKKQGLIPDYSLRFEKKEIKGGYALVFADRTSEFSNLTMVVWMYIVLGAIAFAILLFVSEFLTRNAIAPVAKSMEEQKRFVADASHELKTPLTVILADTDILLSKSEAPPAERKKWLESIRAEAGNMSRLINDMLTLAKSDAAMDEATSFLPVNFSSLVNGCLLSVEALAFEKNVSLQTNVEDDVVIWGDEDRIKRLIMILTDNALKYVNAGGTISVLLANGQRFARFTIVNSGEPISEEKQKHVFDRFYRADESRSHGGYGLGLSIAQNITAVHKGEITLDYSNRAGTSFTVLLPYPTLDQWNQKRNRTDNKKEEQ